MIRRSAKQIVRNELLALQIWKVCASGLSPSCSGSSGSRNGGHQSGFISSSCRHSTGAEDFHPLQGFGIVPNAVPDARVTSPAMADETYFLVRQQWITKQFGITGTRDHRWWIGRTNSSTVVGYHGAELSPSKSCSGKPARSPHHSSSLLEPWNSCGTMRRMLSTKPKDGNEDSHSSLEEEETPTKEDVTARPKTIDDFQHEEIVGPTVERDESDTANQLRESLGELTTFMTNLRNGFVILGSAQLLALLWSSAFHGVGFFVGLSQDFSLVMSFVFAYLLRVFGSRVEFFSKIEGRSRMKILTLSLQANRMLSLFFFRSTFVVKAVALCSLLALVVDIWHSYFSEL